MDWLYAILSAAFGLVVGSFLNVVIYRLPVKGKFFEKSRSYCPKCGAEVKDGQKFCSECGEKL